jgi:ubiquinone/menaquinone biosynthesis C-methylase UbiE
LRHIFFLALLLVAGCDKLPGQNQTRADADYASSEFPKAHRPVAPIVSARFSTEVARDNLNEAKIVMDRAGIVPGMTVADIGAGEGYYTIRLAERVGEKGRVLAEDIVPAVRDALAERVTRERLDNVSVRLGTPSDAKLPPDSFDRIFMVHMYHEIETPYEFMWRIRPALKQDGRVIVVDMNRPAGQHGIPKSLLQCELEAVGFRQIDLQPMPLEGAFYSVFERRGARPLPGAIKTCIVSEQAASQQTQPAH